MGAGGLEMPYGVPFPPVRPLERGLPPGKPTDSGKPNRKPKPEINRAVFFPLAAKIVGS